MFIEKRNFISEWKALIDFFFTPAFKKMVDFFLYLIC